MKAVLTLVFVMGTFLCSAQVFDIDTLSYVGTSESRINIVVMGDGYTSDQLDDFIRDAENFRVSLFNETPYKEYKKYFNVFAIKVPSNESGASHPGTATDVTEPVHSISEVDNYFGSTFDAFNIHRLVVAENTFEITNVLASNFPVYDQAFILVNSSFYGGSGGNFPTATLNVNSNEIAIHELGHSFVNLIDEYYAGDVFSREGINMTKETDASIVRWKNWINTKEIGIYQHSGVGDASLWYRPHQNCKMRFLNRPFCAVCIEGTIEEIHSLTSPLLSYMPNTDQIDGNASQLKFSLDLIDPEPNTLKSTWSLNSEVISNESNLLNLDVQSLENGTNTLSVFIQDTTELLRVDNHESIHVYSVTWNIEFDATTNTHEVNNKLEEIDINISPNPATDRIFISWDKKINDKLNIKIFNVNGEEMNWDYSSGPDHMYISMLNVPSGNYYINFYLDNTLITTRQISKH